MLKTINAGFRPEARERLRNAIGGRDDIRIVDAMRGAREIAALFRRADCYVSLHRAEGFGLTLAESMALGKPVIATGFSGNMDFMTPANAYLVDWRLTEVGPEAEHYPEDGTWAEPSLEHAAQLMREVYGDQEAAAERGARAAADVAAQLSPEAVGAIARAGSRGSPAGAARRPRPPCRRLAGREFEHRLEFDLGGGQRSGPKGVARRARVPRLQPYTTSERALDRAWRGDPAARARAARPTGPPAAASRRGLSHDVGVLGEHVERVTAPPGGDARPPRGPGGGSSGLVPRVDEAQRQLEELMNGARAVPYMSGDGLRLLRRWRVGRVLGFRRERSERRRRRRLPHASRTFPRPARARGAAGRALRRAARRATRRCSTSAAGRGELSRRSAAPGRGARDRRRRGHGRPGPSRGLDVAVGDAVATWSLAAGVARRDRGDPRHRAPAADALCVSSSSRASSSAPAGCWCARRSTRTPPTR